MNQIAKLEGGQADRLIDNLAPAIEFGYRAGEKGQWNLEMTLQKWGSKPSSAPPDPATLADNDDTAWSPPWEDGK